MTITTSACKSELVLGNTYSPGGVGGRSVQLYILVRYLTQKLSCKYIMVPNIIYIVARGAHLRSVICAAALLLSCNCVGAANSLVSSSQPAPGTCSHVQYCKQVRP